MNHVEYVQDAWMPDGHDWVMFWVRGSSTLVLRDSMGPVRDAAARLAADVGVLELETAVLV